MTDDCSTCEGTGLYAKKTWDEPEIRCDNCNGTGDWDVAECMRLILEVDRVLYKSNPDLSDEIIAVLEERIKERT